ncbi:hypothetical protein F5144DRAFT_282352 [Chaetomium tenue]|uniref:Uncharacterized protein n=1 Tax=Chaetomium tenue TaxID=1854479 RepID=A0ACB7P200_9PEZI|nr:hypothetical protein F5144DRAFT_282352 [Chaetomium globosum]
MSDQDLITYARDAANCGDDLFALLATDATASESDIRRAFRRKALTTHPDKAGDAYDPALYERLERARDVLVSPEARKAYDNGMRAILQKKLQREQMSDKRRRLVEDLERREAEAKRVKTGETQPQPHDAERRAMAARGRAKMEEMRRLKEEAEVRERLAKEKEAAAAAATTTVDGPDMGKAAPGSRPTPPMTLDDYDERIADLEKRLKESQQRKAEKQQRKEERKAERKRKMGRKSGSPPAPWPTRRKIPENPPPSTAAEPQADEDKLSKPAEAAPPAPQSGAGAPPKPSNRFAPMLARLRAAQAKKDEEKRRKAEQS